ncbi:hypothetical protein BX666DRAFT_135060 [Dichotomocladium elegans]|nr:hypothetical protein BX666DRAFT_135060 [Dichotomocladium elegans]
MCEAYMADLKVQRPVTDTAFDTEKMKDTVSKLAKVLSHDATKLTLACKPPRKPAEGIKMISEMSNTFYRLVGFYNTIPNTAGNEYKLQYRAAIRDALAGALALCQTFRTDQTFMVSTAELWETCKAMETAMPANNQEAVLRKWKEMVVLMNDAKSEVHGLVSGEEHDEDEEALDEDQVEVAKKVAKLVDLCILACTKIERRCIREVTAEACDAILELGIALGDETDVVVSQIYDADREEMKQHMNTYVSCALELIALAQKNTTEEHAKWFEMCKLKIKEINEKSS